MKKIIASFLSLITIASLCLAQTVVINVHRRPVVAGGGSSPAFKASSYRDGNGAGSATQLYTSSPVAVATGDMIVACVASGTNATNVSSVCDTSACNGSNNLTFVARQAAVSGADLEIWVKPNATANATASFYANWASGVTYRVIMTALYTGGATSSPADQSSVGTAVATTRTVGNVTTTAANELGVACFNEWDNHTTQTAQGTWVKRSSNIAFSFLDSPLATSGGTYPNGTIETVSSAGDNTYIGIMGTFKGQ